MKTLKPILLTCAVALGFAASAETPDSFIRCVQSDGTQYFDTGVIGKPYTKCEVEFCVSETPAHNTGQIGSIKGTDKFAMLHQNYGWGMHYYSKLINKVVREEAIDRPIRFLVTMEPGNQKVEWNGQSWSEAGTSTTDTGLSMYVFGMNHDGAAEIEPKPMRLYVLKIWQKASADGEYELLRDYKPAKKDGKCCLYDAANETIIYPKGVDGNVTTIAGSVERIVYPTDQGGVTPIQQLTNAVAQAKAGDIITLKSGTYKFPDDVYMADNTLKPTSDDYCKIRLNFTAAQADIVFRGEDATGRKTWTDGSEPVVIDGNGGKAMQLQFNAKAAMRIENIAFVNCFGGNNGSDSTYGNWCNGGAIGIGKLKSPWQGGDNVVITNCVFRNNKSAMGGAVGSKNHFFVQDCGFAGNASFGSGGCLYWGNASGCDFTGNTSCGVSMNDVTDCIFVHNSCENTLLDATTVRNCRFVDNDVKTGIWSPIVSTPWLENCHFTNNDVKVYGAAAITKSGVVTNCTFHGNKAGAQGYAAVTDAGRIVNCRFTCNAGVHGGGLLVKTFGVTCTVENCYFGGNSSGWGGGAARLAVNLSDKTAADVSAPILVFDHCSFETNSASSGGKHGGAILNESSNIPDGVDFASLIVCSNNCQFIRNSASHAAGVEGVTAIGCTFIDNRLYNGFNYLGDAAALSRLVDCDITGGNIYRCSLDRCNIHTITNTGVFNSWNFVTNTLITGCDLPTSGALIGRYTSGKAEDAGGEYVNCTFAGNKCLTFFKVDTANYATFKNCVFAENKDQKGVATSLSADDITRTAWNSTLFAFDHCAYGPIAGTAATPAPTGEGVFLCTNPRFNAGKDPDQPWYAPRYGSSLRAAGDPAPYAADDLDLAGVPRLRDGKVSIGCYECWANPVGLMLLFR